MTLFLLASLILLPLKIYSQEYILKSKNENINEASLNSFGIKKIKVFGPKNKLIHVRAKKTLSLENEFDILKKLDLEYIAKNETIQIFPTKTEKSNQKTNQWWHEVINSSEAWSITEGSSDIIVGVIDTGVDYRHQDLKDNIALNLAEIPNNNLDDDNNGYIDDYYGFNFFSNHSDPLDDNGHGTHCAGIVAANGAIKGTAPGVKILPIKFLDNYGRGDIVKAVEAIDYAIKRGAKILTNSYGSPNPNRALKDIIEYAETKGVLFIAAAGNAKNDNDLRGEYPANFNLENVISVGASNATNNVASFSNYGAMSVDLFAPGVSIRSTDENNTYKTRSGTSMATPFVAGAAALLMSHNPSLTIYEIKERILDTTNKNRSLYAKSVYPGVLNSYHSLIDKTSFLNYPISRSEIKAMPIEFSSDSPYENNTVKVYKIRIPNARYLQLQFNFINVETAYDFFQIETTNGKILQKVTGHHANSNSLFFPHGELNLRIISDHSGVDKGFKITKINYVE